MKAPWHASGAWRPDRVIEDALPKDEVVEQGRDAEL